jgi:hypothetical protein
MNYTSKAKLDFLQHYCAKNFKKLQAKYANVIGIHVAKKTRNDDRINRFSIVFHVTKKRSVLPKNKEIPKFIAIQFPDGTKRKVLTDVVQTRKFSFQNVGIGSLGNHRQSSTVGTLGFFMTKNKELYAVSNMHVFGDVLLRAGKFRYFNDIPHQTVADIELAEGATVIQAFLEEAQFGNGIDAAIARIANAGSIKNSIPRIGKPQGHKNLNNNIHVGKSVSIYAGLQRSVVGSSISALNAVVEPVINGKKHTIRGLTQLDGVLTVPGDSGSVVFNNVNQRLIVGIVIGADDFASYFIPITKILDFFGGRVYTL